MSHDGHQKSLPTTRDAFSSVAVWQMMTFILLLCFVWANEVLDLPSKAFDVPESEFSFYRAMLLSAAVIASAIVSVGHTYERQKAVIRKMLMTCVYCHRVMHQDGSWEHVEEYFVRSYPMEVDRGACPECEKMLQSVGQSSKATS